MPATAYLHQPRTYKPKGNVRGEPLYGFPSLWFDLRFLDLHPSTEPAAIAAEHRRLVAEACEQLGPDATPEQVSEAVILPVWNCRRHMAALVLCDPPGTPAKKPRTPAQIAAGNQFREHGQCRYGTPLDAHAAKLRAVLADGRERTIAELARASGLDKFQVRRAIQIGVGIAAAKRQRPATYRLAGQPKEAMPC